MRTFLIFLGLFAAAAVVSGFLTYPAWMLVTRFSDVPIHRVMERVGMLVLAIATVMFLRRRGLADKVTLGYGIRRALFVRQMLLGLAAGIALMLPLTAVLFALNTQTSSPAFLASPAPLAFIGKLAVQGLLAGFAAAFIEETFCRGAMFSTIKRESGVALAVLLPATLYAATHFMGGRLRIPADQVAYQSGLEVTLNLFNKFSTPLVYIDAFAALLLLGVLLALIRIRTNAIAACIGLHAGGACVIWVLDGLWRQNPDSRLLWLSGSYRGVIGWMACIWFALIAVAYWRFTRSSRD